MPAWPCPHASAAYGRHWREAPAWSPTMQPPKRRHPGSGARRRKFRLYWVTPNGYAQHDAWTATRLPGFSDVRRPRFRAAATRNRPVGKTLPEVPLFGRLGFTLSWSHRVRRAIRSSRRQPCQNAVGATGPCRSPGSALRLPHRSDGWRERRCAPDTGTGNSTSAMLRSRTSDDPRRSKHPYESTADRTVTGIRARRPEESGASETRLVPARSSITNRTVSARRRTVRYTGRGCRGRRRGTSEMREAT